MSAPFKCPRCGGVPAAYLERQTGFVSEFIADARGVPAATGTNHEGLPDGVEAACRDCGHRWRLRKVLHIDQVRERFTAVTAPTCTTCNDTHQVHTEDVGDVMCTRCPTPCQGCRAGGNGPFCAITPCPCRCHRSATEAAA